MTTATVRVESDPRSLMRALSKTFTRTNTVLGEMLQNARRAGATAVRITVNDTAIAVSDDGVGIADFSVLLAVAKSGWEAAIQQSDAPYGIGFMSCLFACEELDVTSRGMQLRALTADLIDLAPAGLTACDDTGHTTITLHRHRLGATDVVLRELNRLVAGFPLPVIVNGGALPRPHALDQAQFIDTPIGRATPGVQRGEPIRQLYLQGLPIRCTAEYGVWDNRFGTEIVHLDSPSFEGRLPERDCLIEPEASAKRIEAGLITVARAYVEDQARCLSETDFVAKYADFAATLGLHDLLNAMNCIPADWVYVHTGQPILTSFGDDGYLRSPNGRVVTRDQLQARGLYVADTDDVNFDTSLCAAHWVYAQNGFIERVSNAWHWSRTLRQEITPSDVHLQIGRVVGDERLEVFGEDITLRVVESLHLQRMTAPPEDDDGELPAGWEATPIGDPVATTVHYDAGAAVLFVTADADARIAVRQVTDFEADDRYDERAYDLARDRFVATRATLLSNDPSELLISFLANGLPWRVPAALRGQSFSVRFDTDGQPVVMRA